MAVNLIDSSDITVTQTGNNIQLETTVDMAQVESDTLQNTTDIQNIQDGNVYSTDEVKTNKTWIDGKPIYRKVFNITSGMSTSFQIEHGISNLDYVELKGNIFSSSTSNSPIYYYSSTDYFRLFRDGNYIKIRYGSGNTVSRIVVILEYTKSS